MGFSVPAGTQVRLDPGESLSIDPRLYHDFEVVPGTGPVLLGEVSMCNDDEHDNRFYEELGLSEDRGGRGALPAAVYGISDGG